MKAYIAIIEIHADSGGINDSHPTIARIKEIVFHHLPVGHFAFDKHVKITQVNVIGVAETVPRIKLSGRDGK